MTEKLVYTYHNSMMQVSCFGDALTYDPESTKLEHIKEQILQYSDSCGIVKDQEHRVTWQRVPGKLFPQLNKSVIGLPHRPGFSPIIMNPVHADGVVLYGKNQTIACTSRDCPFLTLTSESTDCVMTLHCGRDQLHNNGSHLNESVIFNALGWFGRDVDPKSIKGVITMGIAPVHFPNERYPKITTALAKRWGAEVIPDSERQTIDLRELILRQLESCNISRDNIAHDGMDTFSDTRFASYRAKRMRHNLTLVTFKT